jgi:cytochrome c peroxidase
MKKRIQLLLAGLVSTAPAGAGDGILDLTSLANYANQPVPTYIRRDNTPAGNPITNEGSTLGRVLFYDKRLSRNNTVSCSSCHQQARAFGDTAVASNGVAGTTGRHSMRLINSRFGQEVKFFWDERAATLEAQTSQPIQDHVEMGFSGTSGDPAFADLVDRLEAIPEYRVLFAMTFGSPEITETNIQSALAQFVRSIQSFDSKYDTGRALVANDGQNFPNFTAEENQGKTLFLNPPGAGGAGCAGCHRPPEFDIDPNSLNNGIIGALAGGTDLTNTRSPTLRDLTGPNGSNGPFMHNGIFTNLNQVVNHYNVIPGNNANLDPRLQRPGGQVQNLGLTPGQRNALVAFLNTLGGTSVYTDAKWSDPFNATGELGVIVLPASVSSQHERVDGTFTFSCQAAPGLNYTVESTTDFKKWTQIGTVSADIDGVISHTTAVAPPAVFYRFSYTP